MGRRDEGGESGARERVANLRIISTKHKPVTYQWDATDRTFRVVHKRPMVGGLAECQDMVRERRKVREGLVWGVCTCVEVGACIVG